MKRTRTPKPLALTLVACLLAACPSGVRPARARAAALADAPPESVRLPRPFARFTAAEVLAEVFDGYDAATGRVAGIPDERGKPALVRVTEAKPWYVNGEERLVVLAELSAYDEHFSGTMGLCGNCVAYPLLAVLRRDGRRLSLVARQDVPRSSDPRREPEGGDEERDPFAPNFRTGHDFGPRLDLAPYRLSKDEMLIGVRLEHMYIPAATHSTGLELFRVEGRRLRRVFDELVVEREWDAPRTRGRASTIDKTTSVLYARPSRGEFNELVVGKTTVRCVDKDRDDDCGTAREPARVTGRRSEVWRFDGEKFYQTTENGGLRR